MKFEEALKHLREGKKIRNPSYEEGFWLKIVEDVYHYVFSISDIHRDDWELYEETKKTHECRAGDMRCFEEDGVLFLTIQQGKEDPFKQTYWNAICCPFCGYSTEKKEEPKTMNFAEAMKLVSQGKKVARESWFCESSLSTESTFIQITYDSIKATDWIEVKE